MNAKKLGQIVRFERRRQNLTQVGLADLIQSTQPQISALEKGIPGVLSDAKITNIAKVLEIEPGQLKGDLQTNPFTKTDTILGICSNAECPSVNVISVGSDVFHRPKFLLIPRAKASGCHCRICGEVIITLCEACETELSIGYHCGTCGESYLQIQDTPNSPEQVQELGQARSKVLNIPTPESY